MKKDKKSKKIGGLLPLKPVKHKKDTVDLLMNEYNKYKTEYKKAFSNKISQSFYEGIYLKYSQSLQNYMKSKKNKLKFTGNKLLKNIPIEIFLEESNTYKQEILNDLQNNKSISKENIKNLKIYLTPLPDTPRVFLKTQEEKDEFHKMERKAVVMRTFEYTNALRIREMDYFYRMNNEQKAQMIYIYKKAAKTVQKWWRGLKGALNKKKEKIRKRNEAMKKLFGNLEHIIKKRKKMYFDDLKNGLKNLIEYKKKLKYQGQLNDLNNLFKSIKNFNDKKVFKKLKNLKRDDCLRKIILDSYKQGKLWKFFQLWSCKNILIHIFVRKITEGSMYEKKKYFMRKTKTLYGKNYMNKKQSNNNVKIKKDENKTKSNLMNLVKKKMKKYN